MNGRAPNNRIAARDVVVVAGLLRAQLVLDRKARPYDEGGLPADHCLPHLFCICKV